MNSHQAKQIDLPDLLSRLGYQPIKTTKGGRELWYPSPFRKEKEPSFHTSFLKGKWIWNDFGDAGGNVIDFVMRHESLQFKEALRFLKSMYQGSLFEIPNRVGNSSRKPTNLLSFQQHGQQMDFAPEGERELEFIEAHDIASTAIVSYLENERRIPAGLAKLYLKEVKYRNNNKGKTFFAFGMENESNGYEIRAASDRYKFKSALIKRDITVIRGRGRNGEKVSVFEGMTDFLSLLVLKDTDRLNEDAVIMHSVSTFNRTVQFIKGQGYKKVLTFLDNDRTGRKYSTRFEEALPSCKVVLQNQSFRPYKDLNEALVASTKMNLPELGLELP